MACDRPLLKQEFERKLFHTAWAILPLIYYLGYPRDCMLLLTLVVLLIWSGIEVGRRHGYSLISPGQLREHEKNSPVMGTFFQVLSMFLAVLLFDQPTAVLAMLFCCAGDSVTGFAGALLSGAVGACRVAIRDYRRSPLYHMVPGADLLHALRHRKPVILMGTMFVTCAAIGLLFYPRMGLLMIAAGSLGAVIADGFAWRVLGYTIDDDLTITLAAGAAIWLAAIVSCQA